MRKAAQFRRAELEARPKTPPRQGKKRNRTPDLAVANRSKRGERKATVVTEEQNGARRSRKSTRKSSNRLKQGGELEHVRIMERGTPQTRKVTRGF